MRTTELSAMISVFLVCILFGALLAVNLQPKDYTKVNIKDFAKAPDRYVGRYINVVGWLGDSGLDDTFVYLIPIVISTGKTTTIVWIPMRDTDYYYGLYETNHYNKGTLIELETHKKELIGYKVTVKGYVTEKEVKVDDEDILLYIINVHTIKRYTPTEGFMRWIR